MVAEFAFVAKKTGDLGVHKNEAVILLNKTEDGWALVEKIAGAGARGMVPLSYLREASPPPPPPLPPSSSSTSTSSSPSLISSTIQPEPGGTFISTADSNDEVNPVRLVFPQWQGGEENNIASYVKELDPADSKMGYHLGSLLLNFMAPEQEYATVKVPVSLDPADVKTESGIFARAVVFRQLKEALRLVNDSHPTHILTFGGECSVSVAPFAYLLHKYSAENVVVLWIDAHPDINTPGDAYTGFHAMALAHLLGLGDPDFLAALVPAPPTAAQKLALAQTRTQTQAPTQSPQRDMLPTPPQARHVLPASHVLLVGLRSWDDDAGPRLKTLGLQSLSPQEVRERPGAVLAWIRATGATRVLVHLDLDVLEPKEVIAAVGRDPNGLTVAEVVGVVGSVDQEFDLVGLTVAEHMPVVEIKIQKLLRQLPKLAGKKRQK